MAQSFLCTVAPAFSSFPSDLLLKDTHALSGGVGYVGGGGGGWGVRGCGVGQGKILRFIRDVPHVPR